MPLTGKEYIELKRWVESTPRAVNLANIKWEGGNHNLAEFLSNGMINGTIKHVPKGTYTLYEILTGQKGKEIL